MNLPASALDLHARRAFCALLACGTLLWQTSVRGQERSPASIGTGFVVSSVGHVVTALHVIRDRSEVLVGPVAERRWALAKVVHTDPARDLALLEARIAREPLPIADWSQVPVGIEAVVIGYPQPSLTGLNKKVTQGIFNGERRRPSGPASFQLSAEVHKGNSGGPVFAPDGTVIGVVQQKQNALAVAEKTQDLPQNVNYALRSDELKAFLDAAGVQVSVRAPDLAVVPRVFQLYRKVESSVVAVVGRDPPSSTRRVEAGAVDARAADRVTAEPRATDGRAPEGRAADGRTADSPRDERRD